MRYFPQAWHDQFSQHSCYVLLSKQYQSELIEQLPPSWQPINVNIGPTNFAKRWWFLQKQVPQIIQSKQIDLFFATLELSSMTAPCKRVSLVRNFSFYAPLNSYENPRDRAKLLAYRLTREPLAYLTIRRADRLAFVSDFFRKRVSKQLSIPLDKSTVVYHGLDPRFGRSEGVVISDSEELSTEYILAVSTIMPHKNYELLLKVFSELKKRIHRPLNLIIAGNPEHQPLYERLRTIVAQNSLQDSVHFLGRVSHDKLQGLYRNALAFVSASRLETFGHPPVEAMASGTPVLASDIPIHKEICQAAALYFGVNDEHDFLEQLTIVVQSQKTRDKLIKLGRERASQFSWNRTASGMFQLFEETLNS